MKKVMGIVVLALLVAGGVVGQAKVSSDTKVFALELGTGFNYDVDAKASNPTQTISALIGLNDVVQAGFSVIKGDTNAHSFNLVRVIVFPVTDLAVNMSLGGDAANAIVSGFGIGYNLIRNASPTLTTALQGNVNYLFNDISKGNLHIGLNLKLGV